MPVIATLRNPTLSIDELFTATFKNSTLTRKWWHPVESRALTVPRFAAPREAQQCRPRWIDCQRGVDDPELGSRRIYGEERRILCELDSSAYQELVRRQQITLEQIKADHQQAVLA